jgi:hypothetical protein
MTNFSKTQNGKEFYVRGEAHHGSLPTVKKWQIIA